VVQQVVRIFPNNLFLGVACHPRQGVVAESYGPFSVDSQDALNQRIQNELVFQIEFVDHKRVSASVP
jgi:hypothetical protein